MVIGYRLPEFDGSRGGLLALEFLPAVSFDEVVAYVRRNPPKRRLAASDAVDIERDFVKEIDVGVKQQRRPCRDSSGINRLSKLGRASLDRPQTAS